MPSSEKPVFAVIGAVVLGVSLVACGGSTTAGASAPVPTVEVGYVTEPAEPGVPVDPAPAVAQPNMAKVSANTASEDAIATALKAAGVGSPKRWAAEVVEYRPYAADDLNLAKLKDNLLKYNPTQKTLEQILSVLLP